MLTKVAVQNAMQSLEQAQNKVAKTDMKKEMDGCLPLERIDPDPQQWFYKWKDKMLCLNTGRAAIYAAVLDYQHFKKVKQIRKVYVPLYLCSSVIEFLQKQNIPVAEYNLTEKMTPDFSSDWMLAPDEMLVWPNYFGCLPAVVINRMAARYGKQLIIDDTQAYYSPPRWDCYNVYACRKFIGVAEGAYLLHGDLSIHQADIPQPVIHLDAWNAPVRASLTGSNSAYDDYLGNGKYWAEDFCAMTPLTQSMLHAVDQNAIQQRRRKNFAVLHEALGKYNQLQCVDFGRGGGLRYPLLVHNKGLRAHLLEHHVYVTRWWKRVSADSRATEFEKDLADYLYPLVIDQRYGEQDMKELATLVEDFLKV